MNDTKHMLKIFLALFIIVFPGSVMAHVYHYYYDESGNVVERKKSTLTIDVSQDTIASKKEILIDYDQSASTASITLVNSESADNEISASLYNANTNMLVKQQTIVGNKGEMDLTSLSQGIYVITASDQDVTASSKILKK